jgi:hypothetical protein
MIRRTLCALRKVGPIAAFFAGVSFAGIGCGDPVHDTEVDALGPEDPNVPQGPLHRPGQPCVECHGGAGPGRMVMSFGGTIYEQAAAKKPAVAAIVKLIDANGQSHLSETNCAGNFFVQIVDWAPAFPVHASISYGAFSDEMRTHIGRNGSCAFCHQGVDGPSSVQHIYLSDDATQVIGSGSGCK